MDVRIEKSWKSLLQEEFNSDYFAQLVSFVKGEYAAGPVFPPSSQIFRAFDLCPVDQVKAVIIGQDPYHEEGQAHGLCFSVNDGVRVPPSLVNIYKEIYSDTGRLQPSSGNLERWAQQGVLLLNATLTVRAHQAGSHQGKGWERFTDAVIKRLAAQQSGIVFMLWGNFAIKKSSLIDASKHCILTAKHPSPLAAAHGGPNSFSGCRHFSQANNYLIQNGRKPIEW
ncbi:MAG: uracil-DNA glycosylase [Marinilabiliaceae bacterium]|nr:uracil-DNA glycosylase [Marinilabiliaceae bacterium]